MTDRLRRGPGCFVCGERRCHTEIQRRNGTLPQNYRRVPPARYHQRNRDTASGLNANARVFTPSVVQRQSSSGNSGWNPGSGNRVPPLQRPSSAKVGSLPPLTAPSHFYIRLTMNFCPPFIALRGRHPIHSGQLDGNLLPFLLDTGAAVSVLPTTKLLPLLPKSLTSYS